MKKWLFKVLVVLIVGVSVAGCNHVVTEVPGKGVSIVDGEIKVGEKLPDITLVDFSGTETDLNELLDGKVGIIDFWAGWCPFCVDEMPVLDSLQRTYTEEVVVIGVHRTNTERMVTGQRFASELGINYTLVLDTEGEFYNKATAEVYAGMPIVIYVDDQGIIENIKVGPKTEGEMKLKIEELINR